MHKQIQYSLFGEHVYATQRQKERNVALRKSVETRGLHFSRPSKYPCYWLEHQARARKHESPCVRVHHYKGELAEACYSLFPTKGRVECTSVDPGPMDQERQRLRD